MFQQKQKHTHTQKKTSCVKNRSKVVLKTGPLMLRNKIGRFAFLFYPLLQGERDLFKQEMDQCLTQKGQNWTNFNSTTYIYML